MSAHIINNLFSIRKYSADKLVEWHYTPDLTLEFIVNILQSLVSRGDSKTKTIILYDISQVTTKKLVYLTQFVDVEVFQMSYLSIMLRGHYWMPVFELLSPLQGTQILDQFGTRIPQMRLSDPIARLYDFKVNDVIRVARTDKTMSYRRIVNDD